MKGKKVTRKRETSPKKAPAKQPPEELSPEDLERVAGGFLFNWGRRPLIKKY